MPYREAAEFRKVIVEALDLDDGVMALGGGLALHPALAPYWSGGQLAVVEYPQGNTVAAALQSVAQVVDAGLGTSIRYVTMSGSDTQVNLLGQVADGLATFLQDIALRRRSG